MSGELPAIAGESLVEEASVESWMQLDPDQPGAPTHEDGIQEMMHDAEQTANNFKFGDPRFGGTTQPRVDVSTHMGSRVIKAQLNEERGLL